MGAFKKPQEIRTEINLVDYLLLEGYRLNKEKSSSNWPVLEKNGEKLLVNAKNNTYSNVGNDKDRGDVLQFVSNRIHHSIYVDNSPQTFYAALVKLNEYLGINRTEEQKNLLKDKDKYFLKKETLHSVINKEWNHKPIENYSYLENARCISKETIDHPIFRDRIFNTLFRLENSHIITNTAFAKLKDDEIVGLEVRNEKLKNILGDHDGVFISNTEDFNKIDYVFYAESAIDSLSYFEILSNRKDFDLSQKNYCFISFGGNLYESKMNEILNQLDRVGAHADTKFISTTDNDLDKIEEKKPGKDYDVMFTASILNKYEALKNELHTDSIYYQIKIKPENICPEKLEQVKSLINEQNTVADKNIIGDKFGYYTMLKQEKEQISVLFPKKLNLNDSGFKKFVSIFKAEAYIPHKSKGKDWNDDLKDLKKKINDKILENQEKRSNKEIANTTEKRFTRGRSL